MRGRQQGVRQQAEAPSEPQSLLRPAEASSQQELKQVAQVAWELGEARVLALARGAQRLGRGRCSSSAAEQREPGKEKGRFSAARRARHLLWGPHSRAGWAWSSRRA
mmetsp:Transcript_536/g.921  ORF Transcript_536/g.921 Transcript_536/m.921 type:complete len:107 (-) Transcript_536:10-330(-)